MMFWRKVNSLRRVKKRLNMSVLKGHDGGLLIGKKKVIGEREYFHDVINFRDDREVDPSR